MLRRVLNLEKIDDSIYKTVSKFHIPRWKEFPTVDLYADQLVSYLDTFLGKYFQDDNVTNNKDNKIITKTMINNYVKQGILDAPIKKKYNKIHIAKLFVICTLKQVYSINDINELINLATKNFPVKRAYNTFCQELENSIFVIFSVNDYTFDKRLSQEQYILKNVTQSIANKLYVKKVVL